MTIDITTRLKNYKGEVIKDGDQELELRAVLISALNYEDQELRASQEQKLRAFILSQEIYKSEKNIELKSDDIVYIKTRLLKMYTPLVYGQTVQLLGEA